MTFCEECGAQIPDGTVQCPACGATVTGSSKAAYEPASSNIAQSGTQHEKLDDLVLAENEKVVRQYQCSNIKRPQCVGYLTVTNKRIIFQGKASTSRIAKEVVLDSVAGLDSYYGMNYNFPGIILGILLAIVGLYIIRRTALIGIVLLIVGAVIVFSNIQKSFFLSIYSSKATGTPISLGAGARSLVGNGALYTLTSEPTSDTDRMLNELGALVQDLQTLGDHAIEKWSR